MTDDDIDFADIPEIPPERFAEGIIRKGLKPVTSGQEKDMLRPMKRLAWQQRVTTDPELHNGEPCIAGTRIPVRMIVGSLADGLTIEQVVSEYPQLTREDVLAALAYAAEVLHQEIILPLTA